MLYLVGTPIGHLGDLSPRARALLEQVDTIACEDTRRTAQLLQAVGIGRRPARRLLSFHHHNRQERLPQLLAVLAADDPLVLVSDAGLPGISDPGEELAAAARRAGHSVVCVPGPCALTTALVSSGLPAGRFCFEGFLPPRRSERLRHLASLREEQRTLIVYAAPHRLPEVLEDLIQELGDRPAQVSRELTKRHEEQVGPTLSAALQHFRNHPPLGEFTLVVGGAMPAAESWSDDRLLQALNAAMAGGASPSQAAREVARSSGQPRRHLYSLLHPSDPPE
ncbi:16S rRNA (cytidine(1402)-2'-O)-methyltransferase [Synechococcus sp. RSCCF101]|uniref:16S rRNA (cytidine(1402)-2'-O)-methyltransferase n=1 Tax=Synechococcus sp. RSCCF101 TaxID=2511069 RepID=UPI001CD91F61|nr:16S rRNA (cytidine(1402)-2'-O)-methyltransferase [Synechococcus sp. RSCCF101]